VHNFKLKEYANIDFTIEEVKKSVLTAIEKNQRFLFNELELQMLVARRLEQDFKADDGYIVHLEYRLPKGWNDDFDKALKSLGNMYDDEVRAREQLEEIQEFLKSSKDKMRGYKLPIISDNYFVQLSEAKEALQEVVKELNVKPIVIKTLNTRVDTARDLVLKLYTTTNEMIKTAQLAEMSIVYGNRYRSKYAEIDKGLIDAEELFYKGKYKESLDMSLKAVSIVDEKIYRKLLGVYDEQ
jgi:septation ring formation regulator EzrA